MERLGEWMPQLPVAMLVGLFLSICFRKKAWVAVVWVPTLISFGAVCLIILNGIVGLSGLRGPDAGWGGLTMIFYLPILGLGGVGVIACYFCRPRCWDCRALLPAIGLSVIGLGYLYWTHQSTVMVQLVDIQGQPVSAGSISLNNAPRTTGSETIEFKLRRGRAEELSIFTVSSVPTEENDATASSYNLRFHHKTGDSSALVISHTWSRRVGIESKISEGFAEIVPFRSRLNLIVTLPPSHSLVQVPDRESLRRAFNAIKSEPEHHDLSYGYVCQNLGAIEFLPELIAAYGGSRSHRFTVMEGLKAIAGTLEDLDKACREIREAPARKKTSLESYRDQIARLCAWAGVDFDGSHSSEALDRVQQKLLEVSRPLVDFCLAADGGEEQHPGLLSQLGMLNRSWMEEFVEKLLKNPPTDMQAALAWSGVFHRMKAREIDLEELVESPNSLLQAAARDAIMD